MGFDLLTSQRGVRRLDIRFQAIGGCITGVGDGRLWIDGVLAAGFVTLARFHRCGAFALNSSTGPACGFPDTRNVALRSWPRLLALFIKVVDSAGKPSLSVARGRRKQYRNQGNQGNKQTPLHWE